MRLIVVLVTFFVFVQSSLSCEWDSNCLKKNEVCRPISASATAEKKCLVKGSVEDGCLTNSHCWSGKCLKNKCIKPTKSLKQWGLGNPGDSCWYNYDCYSNYCDWNSNQCYMKEYNINCAGYSNHRFTGDRGNWTPKWFSLYGHPHTPKDSGNNVNFIHGAESKNEVALRTHKWGPHKSDIYYDIYYLAPGTWDCTLHFAETSKDWSKKGKRVFNVFLYYGNWWSAKYNIDVYGKVGGYKSYTVTFKNIYLTGNSMSFKIASVKGNPFVSAITCIWKW